MLGGLGGGFAPPLGFKGAEPPSAPAYKGGGGCLLRLKLKGTDTESEIMLAFIVCSLNQSLQRALLVQGEAMGKRVYHQKMF